MAEPDSARTTVVDELGPPVGADPESACVVIIYGDDLGRRLPLTGRLVVGRESDCDVPLEDDTTSRRHAEIVATASGFLVRDLGSTNGTYVGETPVTERALHDGDQIKIGRTIFKFLHGRNIETNYHQVIYQLMTNDGLTQAHNRRSFEQQLARELSRAARYQRWLAVLLFDIDHFKRINDSRGHLAGDEVLRQLARAVQGKIRGEDVLARIGGEEFAILMPEGTIEGALALGERLRRVIETSAFHFEEEALHATCSFGASALLPSRTTTPADLMKPADDALYRAKSLGRNRVCG